MPLAVIPAVDALAISRDNPESHWPVRGAEPNRVEPTPFPRFSPSFRVARGGRVMTVGSCFSRHVENSLAARGMILPARAVFQRPEFATLGSRFLNNFSVPSILNEMAWATGELVFSQADNFVEETPGLYCDIHLSRGVSPAPYDLLVDRRQALSAAYGEIRTCDMIICSLGNTECWHDKLTGLYLNTVPSEIILEKFLNRFEVHVLGFEDITDQLEALIGILKRSAPQTAGIVLAVAPWPQPETYLDRDVILSSSYSKSLLRVAIEEVARHHERVDYFPFYETVTVSARSIWKDDLIHLEPVAIDAIAARLLRAYVEFDPTDDDEDFAARLNPDEPGVTPATVFGELEHRWDVLERQPTLALQFAAAAVKLGRLEPARRAIDLLETNCAAPEKRWIEAQILFSEGRREELIPLLEGVGQFRRRLPYWVMLLTALFETGRLEQGKAAVAEWAKLSPVSSEPYRMGAGFLGRTGDAQGARYMFSKAKSLARTPAQLARINLEFAEYLASLGRIMLARDLIKDVEVPTGSLLARLNDLKLRLNMK
jgi:hypothetical protein